MITEKNVELLSTKIHLVSEKLWKVALFGPDNYRSALVTHYLRSRKKAHKKPAIQFMTELLDGYIEEEEIKSISIKICN